MFKRGEVYFCNLDGNFGAEQSGCRPCVVIQNNVGSKFAPTLIIAPLTSRLKKPLPTHVTVPKGELDAEKESTILCEQIRTIDKKRVKSYVGTCSAATVEALNVAIKVSLGLE